MPRSASRRLRPVSLCLVLLVLICASIVVNPRWAAAETSVSGDHSSADLVIDPSSSPTGPVTATRPAFFDQGEMYIERMPVTKTIDHVTMGDFATPAGCSAPATMRVFVREAASSAASDEQITYSEDLATLPIGTPRKLTWRIPSTTLVKGRAYTFRPSVSDPGPCNQTLVTTWKHHGSTVNGGGVRCLAAPEIERMWHQKGTADNVPGCGANYSNGDDAFFSPSMPTGWLQIRAGSWVYDGMTFDHQPEAATLCHTGDSVAGREVRFWRGSPGNPGYSDYVCMWRPWAPFGTTVPDGWYYAKPFEESRDYQPADLFLDLSRGAPAPVGGPLTSAESFGGSNPSEPCLSCAVGRKGDPVNTSDGDLFETVTDLAIPGRGFALDLSRSYSSVSAAPDGLLGHGWASSYGMRLAVDGTTGAVTVTQENGSQVVFANSAGTYVAAPRVLATLTKNGDGTWLFRRRNRDSFKFDTSGRLVSETDLNGYATMVTYPSATQRIVTDPAGRKLTMTLTSGRITKVTEGASPARTVSYGYSAAGDLTSVTDVGGGVTKYTYDSTHRLLTTRSPRYASDATTSPAPVLTNEYDASGRIKSQTDKIGRKTTFAYSGDGVTTVTDPSGRVAVDTYENGLLVSTTRGTPGTRTATWRYTYDPDTLNLASACDPTGGCTSNTWDARGNLLTSTDPLDRTTTTTYSALNDPLTIKDPSGVTTTMTYDAAGNRKTVSRPLLNSSGTTVSTRTTTYGYGGTTPVYAGDVTSMTDPNGSTWQYRYDSFGDRISETAPPTPENAAGNKTTYGYDTGTGLQTSVVSPKGNLSGATAANFTTTTVRDAFGRATSVRDPLWSSATPNVHRTAYHYDADGNVDQVIDGADKTTVSTYDPQGQLTKVTRPDSTTLTYDYLPDGALKSRTNGAGATTTYTYDALGSLASRTDPKGRSTRFVNDALGRPKERCAAGGTRCVGYGYDASGQLRSLNPGKAAQPAITFAYDALGQRTGMTDQTGSSTWQWDSLGRLTSNTDGNAKTVGYGYDLAGNQTTLTYPGNLTVTNHVDAAGRTDWTQDWLSNKTTFGYDANSQLTTTTLPAATGIVDTFGYDNAGGTSAITVKQGPTTLAGFSTTRNGRQQLQTAATTGITEPAQQYDYTNLGQLKQSGPSGSPATFTYDSADNVTRLGSASTLSYDSANQLCWSTATVVASPTCGTVPPGATTYSYDVSGNRTSSTTGGTTTAYGYDELNRLTTYKGSTTYKYDGDGVRLTKTVSGASSAFVWDRSGGLPMLLVDGAAKYVYGPDGTPLEQISNSGTVTYLHHDQLGSTRLLTSASGATVGAYTYEPYGKVATRTGTVATALQFAGQYADADTGLLYLQARYYDPATGQFLSRDPLEDTSGDPYAYASGDPVNATDPSGLLSLGDIATRYVGFVDGITEPFFGGTAAARSAGYAVFGGDDSATTCRWDYGIAHNVGTGTLLVEGLIATRGRLRGAKSGGESRTYRDVTRGSSVRNIETNATHTEFSENLLAEGWSSRPLAGGRLTVFEKGGAKYVLRPKARSYEGWSADYTAAGSTKKTLKIRLGAP